MIVSLVVSEDHEQFRVSYDGRKWWITRDDGEMMGIKEHEFHKIIKRYWDENY